MAYDEQFAEKVRTYILTVTGVSEKKMFGGLCFLLHGNMCCGVIDKKLMLRIGAEAYDSVLEMKHVVSMDFTGKPLKGMVYVLPEGTKTKAAIKKWIDLGLKYAGSLPKKTSKPKKKKEV